MKKYSVKYLISFLLIISGSFQLSAQYTGDWNAYTSIRTVQDGVTINENTIWVQTSGGIAVYKDDKIEKVLTTIDGLSRLDGQTLVFDDKTEKVFVGYVNGLIDVIDINTLEIEKVEDIYRNQTYNSKAIHKLSIYDNKLFVATDFGIVEYNTQTLFVNDTYAKLGQLNRGININDLYVSDSHLYAATNNGIARIALETEFIADNWETFVNDINIPTNDPILVISEYDNVIYISTEEKNFKYTNNNWVENNSFDSEIIKEYKIIDDKLIASNEKFVFSQNSNSLVKYSASNMFAKTVINYNAEEENFLIGTENHGIIKLDINSSSIDTLEIDGPFRNYFQGLSVEGNVILSGSTQKSARNLDIDRSMGYYVYDGNNWESFNHYTNETTRVENFRNAFTSVITKDYYYIGAWGRGVARHNIKTKEIDIYNSYNSNIMGWESDGPRYPVIIGIDKDDKEDVWLVSRYASSPLYVQTPGEDEWENFKPANAASRSDLYAGLFIDSYNQKWVPLENSSASGTGMLVIDTGERTNPNDDKSIKLTTEENQGNLPHNKVKSIIEDKNGEVWVGTERGISKFMFVDIMVDGGPNEWKSQWLINEDTSAVSRYLLRDVNVSAMAVNAANEKWIGSVNQGVWLLNEEGSKILKRFTTENSPIFSDVIIDIAISEETGEVFIATEKGLISYYDTPRKPVEKMKELKVYPNPFSYDKNNRIIIEGLAESTQIKILGTDGTVVQELEARGGRTEWDGYAYDGSRLGSGVYHVIALEENGSMRGSGKVVIIR